MIWKGILTARGTARTLSGAAVYFISVLVYDSVCGGFVTKATLAFLFLVSLAFVILTIFWHLLNANRRGGFMIEINIVLGSILSLPLYFSLQPPAVPLSALERVWALIGGYMIFPVFIIAIQQVPMGWALDLSFIFTLLTGTFIRLWKKRMAGAT